MEKKFSWTRKCPWCKATIAKKDPMMKYVCKCGWGKKIEPIRLRARRIDCYLGIIYLEERPNISKETRDLIDEKGAIIEIHFY